MAEKLDDTSRRALLSSPARTHDFTSASALVRTQIAARSHRGRVLKENEDHYLVVRLGRYEETLLTSLTDLDVPPRFDEYAYAAVVADGIGGGGAGAVAARLAISTLSQSPRPWHRGGRRRSNVTCSSTRPSPMADTTM